MTKAFSDIAARRKLKDRPDVRTWLASVEGKSARQKPMSSKQSKLAAFRASKPKA